MLRQSFRLALVTDGLAAMQRRKVEALSLEASVDAIIYCWEEGCPKPSGRGFELALRKLDASGVAVIGDNVAHDLPAAVELGLPFIRVRGGRFADVETPAAPVEVIEIRSFPEVPSALRRLRVWD